MNSEQVSNNTEVNYLRGRVRMIEDDNEYVNQENDKLREENDDLLSENEELRKKLALEEDRRKRAEASRDRATEFWRAAEEELTEKMEEIEELKKTKGDASTGDNGNNVSS
ncbi:hypothetical protein F53441_14671 [Fusarium austroafricanum]|uniref:Uncharacterized protein n=1 Tax=Fusarium austroafricanum TaxID=2364996 RepID=A0A8H4NAH4_9HYPO|nr:hypothetical protein F53441_14671 [Fusarium austroafricanum]